LAFLTGLICSWSPVLGWLVLIAAVIWATLRHQRRYAGHISAGMGARLGAVMGLLTFVFFLLLGALSISLRHNGDEIREEMVKQIQQAAARTPDPQVQEMMRWFTTSQGLMVFVGFGLFLLFIVLLVSATATGAVTGAVVSKKPDQ
jgi:hypothetical protein